MKTHKILSLIVLLLSVNLYAQKENTTPLSKNSLKGALLSAELNSESKNLAVVYQIPAKKKTLPDIYEQYTFDKDLNFTGLKEIPSPKEDIIILPVRDRRRLIVYVGGVTSFDVLSMKLKILQMSWKEEWNPKKQGYDEVKKSFNEQLIKPKGDMGRFYGHQYYENGTGVLVIAAYDAPQKSKGRLFSLLNVDWEGDFVEIPVTENEGTHLVTCGQLENSDIFMILAPREGNEYIFAQYDLQGKEVFKSTFIAPSSNLLITEFVENDDQLYFIGLSKNDSDPFHKVFEDYAPIQGRGITTAANYQQDKYEKRLYNTTASTFHILKFENGNLVGAGNTSISTFSSKIKTPPSQKAKHRYKGDKFDMQAFYVAPNGEFLMAGQTTKRKIIKEDVVRLYSDIICFHFDSEANLKAQYVVQKVLKSNKDDIRFPMMHQFTASANGEHVYWEAFEAKSTKGYASGWDAFNKVSTVYANYFPKVAKIDLNKAEISDFIPIGGKKGKHFLYNRNALIWDDATKTRYYIGRDDKFKKLFVAKYKMD